MLWQDVVFARGNVLNTPLPPAPIARQYGLERYSHQSPEGDELILNIQDAHESLAAQKSIAELLESLVSEYDLDLIGVEGSQGQIDTSLVESFPLKDVRKESARTLLEKTHISASEFYKIISEDSIELFGIEDADLYAQNISTFQKLLQDHDRIKTELSGIKKQLMHLEQEVYSEVTLLFESKRRLYEDGHINFLDYWKYLILLN